MAQMKFKVLGQIINLFKIRYCRGQFGISRFSTVECQNGFSSRPKAYTMDLAGILFNWDSLCVVIGMQYFRLTLNFHILISVNVLKLHIAFEAIGNIFQRHKYIKTRLEKLIGYM